MTTPIRGVAIDLDGTLIDSIDDIATAANRMLQELGHGVLPIEIIKSFVGRGLHHLTRQSLAAAGGALDEPAVTHAADVFARHYAAALYDTPALYPGVQEGLRAMRAAGLRLACVTNKIERFSLPLLTHTGVRDFFELILCGDTLARKKPDPLPFEHCAQAFGIANQSLLVIGDSANDLDAARAAGCPMWLVPYGYRAGLPLEALHPDRIVASLAEAAQMLQNPNSFSQHDPRQPTPSPA